MDENLLKALIAGGGIAFGALIAAASSAYSARQKIRALQLEYAHKLQENYLANARAYTKTIYVPLSIALEQLRLAYDAFLRKLDNDRNPDPKTENDIRMAIDDYLNTVHKMIQKGADAFLTTTLDERLRSFNGFLTASRIASDSERRITIGYSIALPGSFSMSRDRKITKVIKGKAASRLNLGTISLNIGGLGFNYEDEELVAAPLNSMDFERRLLADIPTLKLLVKEVTLGAKS